MMLDDNNTPNVFILKKATCSASGMAVKETIPLPETSTAEQLVSGRLKADYGIHDPVAQVAAISTLGQRTIVMMGRGIQEMYQEDRFAFGTLPELLQPTLALEQQNAFVINVLKTTMETLQTQCGQETRMGSTALITVQYQQKIIAANLGDTALYYCHVGDNKDILLLRMTPEHHAVQRLLPMGLALSHSIGDRASEFYGLSHHPALRSQDMLSNGTSFLILASDGLNDHIAIEHEGQLIREGKALELVLQQYFNTEDHPTEESIANYLAAITETNRSLYAQPHSRYDNVTIVVHKVNKANVIPRVFAVFDGHGGFKVAEACRQHCLLIMQAQIPECLTATNNPASNDESDFPPTLSVSNAPRADKGSPCNVTKTKDEVKKKSKVSAASSASSPAAMVSHVFLPPPPRLESRKRKHEEGNKENSQENKKPRMQPGAVFQRIRRTQSTRDLQETMGKGNNKVLLRTYTL
jgi:serine/threonine protein phosphatase PrpC